MRDEQEVRGAIAILGASFVGPDMRRHVWGTLEQEAGRAWAMFQVLGWVAGADDSDFKLTLEYVTLKMQEYTEKEMEKKYASS